MSKEAAMRAMREARYLERAAGGDKRSTPARRPVAPARPPKPAAVNAPTEPAEGLCGHRSMNGRTCTREHGHAAKNHRYS